MILRVFAEQEKPMLSLFSKPQVLEASVEWCRSTSWQTFWQLLPWRLFDVDAMAVVLYFEPYYSCNCLFMIDNMK